MKEVAEMHKNKQPLLLVIAAKIISYVFHPLFIPTYIFFFLMQQVPYEFAGITPWQLKMRLFGLFWLTAFSRHLQFSFYGAWNSVKVFF